MTLRDQLSILKERWRTLLGAVLLGPMIATLCFFLLPITYTATTSLYVSAQGGETAQSAFQGAQLSEQRVKSYTQLVTGDRVLAQVITTLGLPYTIDELRKKVSASSSLDSVVIDIAATDNSAERSAAIADGVAQSTTAVVADLERPIDLVGVPAVATRIVQPANVPTQPSSPGLLLILCIGLFIGFVVGIGASFVRHSMDNSITKLDQLEKASGAPNLGSVGVDSSINSGSIIARSERSPISSEAYRLIRTNLQFMHIDRSRSVYVITSSVPGEGKSTTVANLAAAIAKTGTKVLVIDADLRRPAVAAMLGFDRTVGLTSVLTGTVALENAIQNWCGSTLDVLASGTLPPNPSELLGSQRMRALIAHATERYQVILIDTPPVLAVSDAAAVVSNAHGAVIVCKFKSTTRAQVEQAVRGLQQVGASVIGTVFSMTPRGSLSGYGAYTLDEDGGAAATYSVPDVRTSRANVDGPTQFLSAKRADRQKADQMWKENQGPRP